MVMDQQKALGILASYAGQLSADQQQALLDRYTFTRTVNGAAVQLPDPYAAALAHLMHPDTIKQRSEGGVSETYIDPADVAAYLRSESQALQATWPLDDATMRVVDVDLLLDVQGWGG